MAGASKGQGHALTMEVCSDKPAMAPPAPLNADGSECQPYPLDANGDTRPHSGVPNVHMKCPPSCTHSQAVPF